MQTFTDKLAQTRLHFQNSDLSPGFRLLTDCVLDTRNLSHYRSMIALTEWKEGENYSDTEFLERVEHFLQQLDKEEVVRTSNHDEPLLIGTDLVKTYGRSKFSIGPISFTIQPGQVLGLVGENGNGKTTLLRMLARDLAKSSGTLNYPFSGKGISDYELRTRLTYVPQRTPKWYGSLKNNLKFTATHYGITGEENELLVLMMIIRFGLWNFRHHQWNELSSGYKMRFELARTFLRAPKILLLDEPLANLDVLAQQLILEDLRSLSHSISNPLGIVLSSQQLFEVEKISDNVLFLKNGKPTYLNEANNDLGTEVTVIEFDAEVTREQLLTALADFEGIDLSYNGGFYLLTVPQAGKTNDILRSLVNQNIPLKYFRDISQSTRRLFV